MRFFDYMADILILSARPDDALYSMGASMVKLAQKGKSIDYVLLTRGEAGKYASGKQKELEIRNATEKVGCELSILEGFKDCQITDDYKSAIKIAQVIRDKRPSIIFAPYHTNNANFSDPRSHPDLTNLGKLAVKAARFSGVHGILELKEEPFLPNMVIHYMAPLNKEPTLVYDVTTQMKDFTAIMQCLTTQMERDGEAIMSYLTQSRGMYGRMIKVKSGEPFIVDGPIKLHIENFL
jgi:LmbE family N-acetylglucosaminyl deacetylase